MRLDRLRSRSRARSREDRALPTGAALGDAPSQALRAAFHGPLRRWGSRALFVTLMSIACARERPSPIAPPPPEAPRRTAAVPSTGCSDEVLRRPARKVLQGYASYYADSLAGNPTASGAPYDPRRWSAAHRSLPFGTQLRVLRTDVPGAAPVCVVVNDRGPFSGGRRRILDLSRRAAEQLHMLGKGVVPVRVEVL